MSDCTNAVDTYVRVHYNVYTYYSLVSTCYLLLEEQLERNCTYYEKELGLMPSPPYYLHSE